MYNVTVDGKLSPVLISLFILLVLFWSSSRASCSDSTVPQLQLPKVYDERVDVAGWVMSEKLDGVRGYWDGERLFSKNGNQFNPPEKFLQNFPPFAVEGEIWGGRETFQETVSTVAKKQPTEGWFKLRFGIFDVPEIPGGFQERISVAREWFLRHPSEYAFVIEQIKVRGRNHMFRELKRIEELGGEGLVVRDPDAHYKSGRSSEILKVKNFQDAEANVLAHLPGNGKHSGRMGALLVSLEDGTEFKIGSGFSDKERESPPPVGTVVTFKYYGKYASGIPKFPSFLRLRSDVDI